MRKQKVKDSMLNASELALQLAQDKKFRQTLLSTIEHSAEARRHARNNLGFAGAVRRLASDQALRAELRNARQDLERAHAQLERKRGGHRLRKISLAAGLALLAAVPQVRQRVNDFVKGTQPGRTSSLEDMTKEELYAEAQAADIPGRSEMNKEELLAALRGRA
jgi:hypothetical protein